MTIQVAVLCDAATDESGKLNLLGAFDTIYTQQLPAVHPQCSVRLAEREWDAETRAIRKRKKARRQRTD